MGIKITINNEVDQCKSFSEARWIRNMLLHNPEYGYTHENLIIQPMNKVVYDGEYPWRIYNKINIG